MIFVPYDLSEEPTSKIIKLSRRKVIKKTLKANVILLFVVVVAVLTYLLYPTLMRETLRPIVEIEDIVLLFVVIAVVLVSLVINFLYHYLYYKTYYYNVKDDVLVIRKGIFIPDEISIPYNRIQDIYVDRDTLDLLLGLYDVHVSSATVQSGKDAHIDGVKYGSATKLKEMILEKVKRASVGKDIGL